MFGVNHRVYEGDSNMEQVKKLISAPRMTFFGHIFDISMSCLPPSTMTGYGEMSRFMPSNHIHKLIKLLFKII